MKAYLVLDLTVNDFGGFRKYIAEIPAFIAKHSGKYLVQGVQPTTIEGDWKPERMVIIEFPEREKAEAFLGDPKFKTCSRCATRRRRVNWYWPTGARNRPPSENAIEDASPGWNEHSIRPDCNRIEPEIVSCARADCPSPSLWPSFPRSLLRAKQNGGDTRYRAPEPASRCRSRSSHEMRVRRKAEQGDASSPTIAAPI